MLPPTVVAFFHHTEDFVPFVVSLILPLLTGVVVLLSTRGEIDLRTRDGFAVVAFGWLTAALFGSLPFLLTGVCSPVDALFESMSGFTTTGSTILEDIEGLPPGILLWRSETQWMGGMGIIVLSIAVLPLLGVGGMQLFHAEMPGPRAERLAPRIRSVAKSLWTVYVGLTVAEILLLMLGKLSLMDAVCHAFCTVSTGGFSTRNESIGAFSSAYVELVIILFMFVSGANFALHFRFTRGGLLRHFRDEEFRLYCFVVLTLIALLAASLILRLGEVPGTAFRQAAFQGISILTTTGFGTADFHVWGYGAQLVLFSMMFLGACAGSTSGGLKLMRVIILTKQAFLMVRKELHPRAVYPTRFNGAVVREDALMRILGFFLLYMLIFFIVAIALALLGVEPETALGASIATLSNIGPGLGDVGPASTFAAFPSGAKALLAFNMLLGRLELFTVLVVVSPMFWRRT
jgi:trk system potassium uptake protein TrkH